MNVADNSRNTSGRQVVSHSANRPAGRYARSGHGVDSFARVTEDGLLKNHATTFNHSATSTPVLNPGPDLYTTSADATLSATRLARGCPWTLLSQPSGTHHDRRYKPGVLRFGETIPTCAVR